MRVIAFFAFVLPLSFLLASCFGGPKYYTLERLDRMSWQQEDIHYRVARALAFHHQNSNLKCPGFRFKRLTEKEDGPYWVQCYSDQHEDFYHNYLINTQTMKLKNYKSQLDMMKDLGIK